MILILAGVNFKLNVMKLLTFHVWLSGRAWAATTTEGLLVYSLDSNLVFDPFDLDIDITPSSVKKTLAKGEYSTALMLAFRLNEKDVIQEVLENILINDG